MKREEKAEAFFKGKALCSQAILTTYSEKYGLDFEIAMKLASPFGGGICSRGETCGAVTGSLMVLGLIFGPGSDEDEKSFEFIKNLGVEFIDRFRDRFNETHCKELIGYDLSDPRQYAEAEQLRVFKEVCPNFVRVAAEILEEMIQENS